MLDVLVTTISVPNFMLVSKSAQFTENFELSRRTIIMNKVSLCSNLYANLAGGRVLSKQGQLKLRFHLKP